MMKIRTCVIQCRAKHNDKACTKTPRGREQRHVNGIYARAPARASKMADQCTNTAATQILLVREEAVLRKTPRFKSSNCSAEAIRRFSWLIRYFFENLNWTHTHTTTVTLRCMCAEG